MIPSGYRGAGAHVLISQHGDGEIIARIIARFGHQAIRGSNTRGGAGALRALIKLGRASKDLVVTPAAQRTTTGGQARCHPTGQSHRTSNCSLSLCLLNKTTVRKLGSLHGSLSLFSRFVSLCKAMFVSPDGDDLALEAHRLLLETELNRLTDEAERAVTRTTDNIA